MSPTTACPNAESLDLFQRGLLPEPDAESVHQHLETCPACLGRLEALPPNDALLNDLRAKVTPSDSGFDKTVGELQQKIKDLALNQTQDFVENPAPPGESVNLPVQIGRFRVLERLGAGGMGEVWKAFDPELQRYVAIKLPFFTGPPDVQRQARARFLREARAAGRVRHPHLCPIHDVGEIDGRPFVVMDFVAGQALSVRLKDGPFSNPRQAAQIACQVAQALHAVHEHGIIHRDLKPGNILLDEDGQPFLTDFGLARLPEEDKLTAEGLVPGTPPYMAPEQVDPAAFGEVGPRCDVYCLGVVLYEMLAGRTPFTGTLSALFRQITSAELPPLTQWRGELDPGLTAIVHRALARRPANRFASAAELAETLIAWLNGTGEPPSARVARKTWLAVGVVGAAAALLFVVGAWRLGWFDSSTAPDGPPGANAPAALQAQFDVRVWKKHDRSRGLLLHDPGVLPLQAGDLMRIEVKANRPAYLYVVYLDSAGVVSPLYPWRNYDWQQRPAEERRTGLNLPEDPLKDAAPLAVSPSGIEAIFLLARPEPLSPQENAALPALFAGWPKGQKADLLRGAVWLAEHEPPRFSNALDRGRLELPKAIAVDDPIEHVRRLLRTQLRPLFSDVRAVCYSFQGE